MPSSPLGTPLLGRHRLEQRPLTICGEARAQPDSAAEATESQRIQSGLTTGRSVSGEEAAKCAFYSEI